MNLFSSGTWDGFIALQGVARLKIARDKCLYSGEIRQGQRYFTPLDSLNFRNMCLATAFISTRICFAGRDAAYHSYGRGRCVYEDGRVFEGEWRGDEWYGFGSLFMPDGCAIIGAHWIAYERTNPPAELFFQVEFGVNH